METKNGLFSVPKEKEIILEVKIELTDKSGSHSVSCGALMGAYSFNNSVKIPDAEFEADPVAAVAHAIASQFLCTQDEADEIGVVVANKLVPNMVKGN